MPDTTGSPRAGAVPVDPLPDQGHAGQRHHGFADLAEEGPVPPSRGRSRVAPAVTAAVVAAVLGAEIAVGGSSVLDALRNLGAVHWTWVLPAIGAEAVSMGLFARLQRRLLRAGGVPVRVLPALAATYSANAVSVTLPGGPVFGTAFMFRRMRRWGAPAAVASWALAMGAVLSTVALVVLGALGTVLVHNGPDLVNVSIDLVVLVGATFGLLLATRRPAVLLTMARPAIRAYRALRPPPPGQEGDRLGRLVAHLSTVRPLKTDIGVALLLAAGNWLGDVACLSFAVRAVGHTLSLGTLLVAYAAGMAAANIPLVPGGLGVVDGALTAGLVARHGLTAALALTAVVVYRLISFVLVAVVGWITMALVYRGRAGAAAEPAP